MSAGDDAAFRAYVAARQRALRHTAFLMSGDWDRADDLVQTALTKLYVAWHRVSREKGPDAYAYRILANAVVDERRRPWRREVATAEFTDREDPSTSAPDTDTRLDIAQALAQLPGRQRATLVLRFWADASVADTAEALGCSVGTVKSQTVRGLTALRRLLGATEPLVDAIEEKP